MLSDEWLQRYRLLENFTAKWNGNGNGNAYDRGDYNSSFALRAVELKIVNQSTDCHEFEEKDKSTNRFGTNAVLAFGRTCKAIYYSNVCKY